MGAGLDWWLHPSRLHDCGCTVMVLNRGETAPHPTWPRCPAHPRRGQASGRQVAVHLGYRFGGTLRASGVDPSFHSRLPQPRPLRTHPPTPRYPSGIIKPCAKTGQAQVFTFDLCLRPAESLLTLIVGDETTRHHITPTAHPPAGFKPWRLAMDAKRASNKEQVVIWEDVIVLPTPVNGVLIGHQILGALYPGSLSLMRF